MRPSRSRSRLHNSKRVPITHASSSHRGRRRNHGLAQSTRYQTSVGLARAREIRASLLCVSPMLLSIHPAPGRSTMHLLMGLPVRPATSPRSSFQARSRSPQSGATAPIGALALRLSPPYLPARPAPCARGSLTRRREAHAHCATRLTACACLTTLRLTTLRFTALRLTALRLHRRKRLITARASTAPACICPSRALAFCSLRAPAFAHRRACAFVHRTRLLACSCSSCTHFLWPPIAAACSAVPRGPPMLVSASSFSSSTTHSAWPSLAAATSGVICS
mmetsp:Transcript_28821/g.78360  ORF Transcript_28821/g.78360 Transcript_28821/m.78360 type:complete len:279 (+) Transcript_28821:596-1432(+)